MSGVHAFVGGMRGPRGANATWPFAGLTIDHSAGVSVGVRGAPWLPGLRQCRFGWGDLDHVEAVRGVMGSYGVRLVGQGHPRVVFWTNELDEVLAALEAHGARVSVPEKLARIWIRP